VASEERDRAMHRLEAALVERDHDDGKPAMPPMPEGTREAVRRSPNGPRGVRVQSL
jgi:hypothetical protein